MKREKRELNRIICGDVVRFATHYKGPKFHAMFCDPPYELGFMGRKWDKSGIAFQKDAWEAMASVLRPGAMVLVFGAPRTFHRMAVAIEDAGLEIRDTVMWVHGGPFPKSHNLDGAWDGYGTALKPAYEPVIVARMPMDGTVENTANTHGTGVLNIDGTRIPAEASHVDNWARMKSTQQGMASKGLKDVDPRDHAPSGRWPANLMHDGSEEVLELFPYSGPTKRANKGQGFSSDGSIDGWKREAHKGNTNIGGYDDAGGSAARFFYCAKAQRKEREAGLYNFEPSFSPTAGNGIGNRRHNAEDASAKRNIHPTVKPLKLTEYLARLILPPSAVEYRSIFIPFAGVGSEVIGSLKAGWDCVIGVEKEQGYIDIANARIKHWC